MQKPISGYVCLPRMLVLFVVGFGVCLTASVTAQEPPVEEPPQNKIQVFSLRYVQADAFIEIMAPLLGETALRVAPDLRTNSLIVHGTSADMELLSALIERLDSPETSDHDDAVIETLDAKRNEVRMLADTIQSLDLDLDIATTQDVVVLRGRRDAVNQAQELLRSLTTDAAQQAMAAPAVQNVTAEIVWLQEKSEAEGDVTGSLEAQLAKRGFRNLSKIGTLQIASMVDAQGSRATGSTKQGHLEARLTLGRIRDSDALSVELELQTGGGIQFSSEITTKLNQSIVFGVSASLQVADDGFMPRSVFLLRLVEQQPLADTEAGP